MFLRPGKKKFKRKGLTLKTHFAWLSDRAVKSWWDSIF